MSAAAADWVRAVRVDDGIWARWPDYQVHLVAADDVDVDGLADVAARWLDDAERAARAAAGAVSESIERWSDAYLAFGVKPRVARSSVDALVRRAVSERGLPRIGTLVDLYNAVSVLHHVPIGGEDLDRYDGAARLTLAVGDEPFLTRADGEVVVEHPEPGEPVWLDGSGVTCRRWNWRQTTRTAIDDATRRVGFIIDSLDAPRHEGAARAAEQLAGVMRNAVISTIDRSTPR